ncbi:5528_t:CDS:2, partial [Cetraspora pellucida]
GFSKIYSAICVNGIKDTWNGHKQEFKTRKNRQIVLKSLNNSDAISPDFLNELKNYFRCSGGEYIHKYYSITQNPETNNYMIVTDFVKH